MPDVRIAEKEFIPIRKITAILPASFAGIGNLFLVR
jgi:hypothetical protein